MEIIFCIHVTIVNIFYIYSLPNLLKLHLKNDINDNGYEWSISPGSSDHSGSL